MPAPPALVYLTVAWRERGRSLLTAWAGCGRGQSLDGTAAACLGLGAVAFGAQCFVERVEAGIARQRVAPGWHALVNAVQTFSLCEAGDLVLWRKAFDGVLELLSAS